MNINEIKEEIRNIFREILCREIPEDNDISFLEIGGGSFEFSKLQVKIKKKYGQKIPLKVLFRNNSVNSIAEILCECVGDKANEEKICPQSESVSITECPNCRKWVRKGDKYCSDCGQAISWESVKE